MRNNCTSFSQPPDFVRTLDTCRLGKYKLESAEGMTPLCQSGGSQDIKLDEDATRPEACSTACPGFKALCPAVHQPISSKMHVSGTIPATEMVLNDLIRK